MSQRTRPAGQLTPTGRHSQKSRLAFSLIELVLVLVLTIALMTGTIALITIVQRSSERADSNLLVRQEIRRFADDFRRDMHLFPRSQVDGDVLRLSGDDSKVVEYSIEAGSGIRRHEGAETDTISRDAYRFGKRMKISVEESETAGAVQWTLIQSDRTQAPMVLLASGRASE